MFDPLKTFESKNIIVWCRIIKPSSGHEKSGIIFRHLIYLLEVEAIETYKPVVSEHSYPFVFLFLRSDFIEATIYRYCNVRYHEKSSFKFPLTK